MTRDTVSEIHVDRNGTTTYRGPDGVALFRAHVLHVGLQLYARTGMLPNTAWTPMRMLAAASNITSKVYRRGEYQRAAADVKKWINAMMCAMPVTVEKE